MDRITQFLIVVFMVFCVSCAQQEKGPRFFWQEGPEKQIFEAAEQKYQQEAYPEAIGLYQEYLTKFPEAGMAPAALLKIGMIRVYQGEYEKAIHAFDQVQATYPGSPYAREAGVGKLAVYYKAGDYEQVTVYAGNVLAQSLAPEQGVRVNLIVGDSYMALKSPKEAYDAYLSAFENAVSENEKKRVISRLKTAVSLLAPSDLMTELEKLDGRPPSAYLRFYLGVAFMDQGFSGEAVASFSTFLENYPGHEYAGQAEKFIAELESSAVTERRLIGCLLPLTGKYEKIGQQALEGIEFALARFARERAGAVPSLGILVEDTASDPLGAQKGLMALAAAEVSAIIGPIATADAIAPEAQAQRIPMIALTQKPGVTDAGDYVFRNFLTPAMQINTLVDHAVHQLGASRFAILYPNESYGDIYMNLFWDAVMAAGGRVVGVEAYDPGITDFADSIQKLVGLYYDIPEDLVEEPVLVPQVLIGGEDSEIPARAPEVSDILSAYDADSWHEELMAAISLGRLAAERKDDAAGPDPIVDFDAVFIPDAPDKAGLIIPQLAYYDVNDVQLLGTNLWHSDKLLDIAKYNIQGAILTEGFFEQSRREHVRRFVAEFKSLYGEGPGFIQAVAYDTAWLLFDLVSRPDIRFRAQIKNTLPVMPPFSGVTGTTVFDPSGEAVKEIYLLQIKGRRFEEIETYPRPPAPLQ